MFIPKHQLAQRRDQPVLCPGCGRRVERTARQQKYCSAECRKGESAKLRSARSRCTRAPKQNAVRASNGFGQDEPPEKTNDFRRLQRGVFGPAKVIAAEIFAGRAWTPTVSKDGVPSLATPLKPPLLRE
jgi:hypothetical protein